MRCKASAYVKLARILLTLDVGVLRIGSSAGDWLLPPVAGFRRRWLAKDCCHQAAFALAQAAFFAPALIIRIPALCRRWAVSFVVSAFKWSPVAD